MFNSLSAIEKYVTHNTLELLHLYIKKILHWNRTTNITSKNNTKTRLYNFICEAIAIAELLNHNYTLNIADVGSGNGFPGLVLNILGFKNCSLIEINSKKAAFLQYTVAELNLSAKIFNLDVKDLRLQNTDVITSKAVMNSMDLKRLCKTIQNEKTRYILCKNGNERVVLKDKNNYEQTYSFENL